MKAAGRGRVRPALRSAVPAAAFTVVLGVLLQVRFGYEAGTNDHLVLSLQGLQWAWPGYLVDDWFVASSPQPHLLFDGVTWLGARTGHLSAVYVGWWLLGLMVGGAATGLLARRWAPTRPVGTATVVAALLALGPQVALGSTTPALPTALPHELGGFLGYLTCALLLTRRPRAAALACVATGLVHVQVGAIVAVIGVLASLVAGRGVRRGWWAPVVGAFVTAGWVVTALRLRPVTAAGDDFVQICREVIPFHCDATTWSAGQLGSGFAVVAAALLSFLAARAAGEGPQGSVVDTERPPDERLLWAAVVGVPALGLAGGVLANLYGVPVLGRLAQTTNVFRLAVLAVPFGAWGLVAGLGAISRRARLVWLVAIVPIGVGWLLPADGTTLLAGHPAWTAAVLAVAVASGLVALAPARRASRLAGVGGLAAVGLLVVAGVACGRLTARVPDPVFVPVAAHRAIGAAVAARVPPGGVVLTQPAWGDLRLTSGRSLVADCKAVPYGGPPWHEYRARLTALGGRVACHDRGAAFVAIPADRLAATAARYGAGYAVLTAGDPRVRPLTELGWRVLDEPRRSDGEVWILAAPGAQTWASVGSATR